MDKARFLAKLRSTLRWRMPPRELLAVLADYKEYFQSGAEEGQSEQALCQKFGDPREIAAAMAAEKGLRLPCPPYLLAPVVGVLLLLLMSYALFSGNASYFYTYNPGWWIFGSCCMVLSILSMLCCHKDVGTTPSKRFTRQAVGFSVLALVLTVAASLLCLQVLALAHLWDAMGLDRMHLGPTVALFFFAIQVLLPVLWLWELVWAYRLPRWALVLFPCNAALLATFWKLQLLLHCMSDPDALVGLVVAALFTGLWQLLPLLLLPLLCRKETTWTAR